MSLGWAEGLLLVGMAAVVAMSMVQWGKDKATISRLKSSDRESVSLSSMPRVSVLIPAWNEGAGVEEAISGFLTLDYPNRELIVCAGGRDDTYTRALRYQREGGDGLGAKVVVIEQLPGEGKQGALRKSLECADGEIIFLTDADSLLDDESFMRTLEPLVNQPEVAATGLFRPFLKEAREEPFVLYQWYLNSYAWASFASYRRGLVGVNAAVRRCILIELEAFKVDVATGIDYHLSEEILHAGYRIRNVAESMIQTKYPDNFPAYVKQQSRWLKNVVVHGVGFGSWKLALSSLRTSFVGLGMLLFPLTFPFLGPLGLYAWVLALLYGFLSRVRYMRFGEIQHGVTFPRRHYLRLILYMFMDFIAWAYTLVEYLSPRLRRRW